MKMNTRRQGDVTVIDLEGHLDFEATRVFYDTAMDLLEKAEGNAVVFNFSKLRFVGSSGISQFIKVLKKLNSTSKPKFCNLSSEFLKMFRAYQTARNPFQIFDDEDQALASLSNDPLMVPGVRRKPISN